MANDKLTILMIDDDPEDIAIVRGMLERVPVWSVDLVPCLDVAQAAQQTEQRKPDLILLDFNFGVSSGLDALPAIRAAGFAGPIILLSGCGKGDVASMVIAGLNDFLPKDNLSSLTLYHAITLAMEKQMVPAKRNTQDAGLTSTNQQRNLPSATSSSPPKVRYPSV
jgi:CheY-like chemotaxis protein